MNKDITLKELYEEWKKNSIKNNKTLNFDAFDEAFYWHYLTIKKKLVDLSDEDVIILRRTGNGLTIHYMITVLSELNDFAYKYGYSDDKELLNWEVRSDRIYHKELNKS